MFIQSKLVDGHKYFYLVENYRDKDKVRQRELAYLGKMPDIKSAIDELQAAVAGWENSRIQALEFLAEQKTDRMKNEFIKYAKTYEKRRDRAQQRLDKILPFQVKD